MTRVLFVCIHNSARSQMAEAFLNHLAGDRFTAESAGLTPGRLNPMVIAVMKEQGLDISGNTTDSVFDFFKEGRTYDFVITVCEQNASERCPMFPGTTKRLHWSFANPSEFTGTKAEIEDQTRAVRDQIRKAVVEFIAACSDFRSRVGVAESNEG